MNEIIEIIIWSVFWYFVFAIASNLLQAYMEVKVNAIEENLKHLNEIVHRVKEEKHGSHTYWFDEDTDAFLAQGANNEEIIAHLKSRFPNHLFFLPNQCKIHAPRWEIEPYDAANFKNVHAVKDYK